MRPGGGASTRAGAGSLSTTPGPVPDSAVAEFVAVMRRLRVECAWKQEQTHRSLTRYLLEEAYEAIEAIESGDDEHLQEELGDVLLQVVFHAVIAEQRGAFDLDDVARAITAKMRRRNPHVFGVSTGSTTGDDDGSTTGAYDGLDAAAVNDLWQQVKASEGRDKPGRRGLVDSVPAALPALLYADKVLDRLERAGHAPAAPAAAPDENDLGERLLALVAEARASGVDPEQALREAVRRRL